MDDTHSSRTSDVAAAATRKRRSSILKSQRPPRTPFSELEFNVATPTDTTKSRRVSFSRRTGVAEFVTNEATNTWKNFYEEHNKSLESSGNESGANAARPIGHIGKRIFDQQFQEVEAVDFGSTLDNRPNRNINTSINNVNFSQQLASLECTGDDRKLSVPQQNFEMSAFTDHQSKLFADDLAITTMGEMSGRIDVNFSVMQTLGEVKDDLDEIQNDLHRAQGNVVCPGPFTGRRSLSEYIEVDLNTTRVAVNNGDDDMSITDTIPSPKVQDVSKNQSSIRIDKKAKDWVADRENIIPNPYVTPKESKNFAVNDESDKVIVFDGKRLTIQTDEEADKILKCSTNDMQPTISKNSKGFKKNIVLNVNDDLPNFIDDPLMLSGTSFKHSVMYDDGDNLTNENKPIKKRNTIHGNETGNISISQGVPSNIVVSKNLLKDLEISKTVVFDSIEADISTTRALPSKIICFQESKTETQRRRTILYENDMGDVSITQAIPANIILSENKEGNKKEPERRRTILYDNDMSNISMTQAIPANIILSENKEGIKQEPERGRTILYDNDMSNISMTQAIPANIILNENKDGNKQEPERRRTILYDNDMSNISMTQAIPANIILNENKDGNKQEPERRRTILYDNDMSNISMTQAIPANIILNENKDGNKQEPERRRTILYDNDMSNISMTQAIPANIILNKSKEASKQETERRRTIIYDNDMSNISITQAIPANIILNEGKDSDKSKTILYENVGIDISMTQPISTNVLINHVNLKPESDDSSLGHISSQSIHLNVKGKSKIDGEKSSTVEYDHIAGNVSTTNTVPTKGILPGKDIKDKINIVSPKTDLSDISITRAVPTNILLAGEKLKTFEDESFNITITRTLPSNIIGTDTSQVSNKELKSKNSIVTADADFGDMSITKAVVTGHEISQKDLRDINTTIEFRSSVKDMKDTSSFNATMNNDKRKTIVYEDEAGNISVTRTLPNNILEADKSDISDKLKTILYENNAANVSVAQAVLVNVVIVNNALTKTPSVRINEAETCLAKENASKISEKDSAISKVSDVQKNPEQEHNILPKSSSNEKDCNDAIENMPLVRSQPTDLILEDKPALDNRESSSDGLIYIIRDVEVEMQTDNTDNHKPNKTLTWNNDVPKIQHSPLSLEYKEEVDAEVTDDLPKKLNELKNLVNDKNPQLNRQYEKSTDQESVKIERSPSQDKSEILKGGMSFRNANDTNELLEMLSDLTDRRHSKEPVPDEKIEPSGPKRLSVAPNRLSIVLSREDFLSNISMAQAALKQPIELDESMDDTISDTQLDTPSETNLLTKTTGRISSEVVKKLHFEDESASEASIKSDTRMSPLKKTAFGETSYMKDSETDSMIKAPLMKPALGEASYVKETKTGDMKESPLKQTAFGQPSYVKDSQTDDMTVSPLKNTAFGETHFMKEGKSDNMTVSPLKKTAIGETSFVKDTKTKIIPNYFKDVSDDIKALMNDLVKPNADSIPFQVPPEFSLDRTPSICSTQIQANLVTSSQIDLGSELGSNKDSVSDIDKASMVSRVSMHRLHSLSNRDGLDISQESFPKQTIPNSTTQDRVIVFDHYNPLNNILLVPVDFSDVHKYDPHSSNESLCGDSQSVDTKEVMAGNYTNEMKEVKLMASVTVQHLMPSGDTVPDRSDAQSILSNISKPASIDQSVSASMCEVQDTEVNTLIAMKENHELLKESSSLTLVDDALVQSDFDINFDKINSKKSFSTANRRNSPVKVKYHIVEDDVVLSEKPTDLTTSDEMMEPVKISAKGKKRNYSPTVKNNPQHNSLDTTPKHIVKMMKMYNSPKHEVIDKSPETLKAEKDENRSQAMDIDESSNANKSPKKLSPRKPNSPSSKKPGTTVTVQQLLTKYDIHPDIDQEALNKQIIKALSRSDSSTGPTTESLTDIDGKSVDIVSSFTSSKNQNEMREALDAKTIESHASSRHSRSEKMELQPETNTSSVVSECGSSVNVVAKIDMLPFMGSQECEWEASGTDTWSFRLLHARLRLHVRLAHRHDNATRTRVRADTPVLNVAVELADNSLKSPVAIVCVGFALDTMRYYIGRGCSKAGDVPTLLRRCAAVARLAMRWGPVMHEAWMHLAFTLEPDGYLALKVANIPLRSVWEVTMRLELIIEDGQVPHPRACDVRVTRVVSDVPVSADEVRRALGDVPKDWGHVPRTVWKIFRHLKNKKPDGDLLGV